MTRRLWPGRRFTAYALGDSDWWVTIERLATTDDLTLRWVWTVRRITMITASGAVVPSPAPIARGYARTKPEARALAYRAALEDADDATPISFHLPTLNPERRRRHARQLPPRRRR